MATGALDANGIWIYGEDDSETTFSGLLNKLGDSVSDKFTGGLPIASGGTGATTATDAKTNLGIPYAFAAGVAANVTVPSSSIVNTAITFPAGRFSAAPVVQVSMNPGNRAGFIWHGSVTSTGFTMVRGTGDATSFTAGGHWTAVQMTSTSGAG